MAHLGCYLPIITACYYQYFTPTDYNDSSDKTDCYDSYRLYLLVSGSCLILPTLMVFYIIACYRRHALERVEDMSSITFIVECVIFTAIYIYYKILDNENDGNCENTGTLLGSLVMIPLYVAGASCSLFGACMLSAYIYLSTQGCLRRICCCFGGTALIDRSLPRISYSQKDFKNETECSICLNDF